MSVKIMSMIFERYPAGGGEMILALALADHAHDDGSHVYPSVSALAKKTRQSERTVQYQLRKMESSGWLMLVADENGGRGKTREYKINEDWIKGANIAPVQSTTERVQSTTERVQSTTERVQSEAQKGAIAVAPESSYNHQLNIKESLKEKINKKEKFVIRDELLDVTDQTFEDFVSLRKAKRAPLSKRAIEQIRSESVKAGITLEDALIECCARGWQSFKAEWYKNIKPDRQRTFENSADRLLQSNLEAVKDWVPPEMRVVK